MNLVVQTNIDDASPSQFAGGCLSAPGSIAFERACRSMDTRSSAYRFVKRAFDIVFSLAAICVGAIPCLLLALCVACDTRSTPLYKQERIGQYGRPFHIVKFRTMVADSDDLERYFCEERLADWRREGKVDNDPRITKLGAVLRKTSIDELPQFLNVLLGQLSIVGPRAITRSELENYGSESVKLLSVPQGITGRWQCGARNDAVFSDGSRQAIELSYVKDASVAVDLLIMARTAKVMLFEKSGK